MKIKSVEEMHYGFNVKYLVTYENGTWEWHYYCLKSFLPYLNNK
jgi:hypothetical protein